MAGTTCSRPRLSAHNPAGMIQTSVNGRSSDSSQSGPSLLRARRLQWLVRPTFAGHTAAGTVTDSHRVPWATLCPSLFLATKLQRNFRIAKLFSEKIVESFSLDDLIHTILIRRSVAEYWFFATTVGCYAFGNCFCPSLALFYTM